MQLDRVHAREEPAIRLNDETPYSFVVLFVPCLVLPARFYTVHVGIGVICASQVWLTGMSCSRRRWWNLTTLSKRSFKVHPSQLDHPDPQHSDGAGGGQPVSRQSLTDSAASTAHAAHDDPRDNRYVGDFRLAVHQQFHRQSTPSKLLHPLHPYHSLAARHNSSHHRLTLPLARTT